MGMGVRGGMGAPWVRGDFEGGAAGWGGWGGFGGFWGRGLGGGGDDGVFMERWGLNRTWGIRGARGGGPWTEGAAGTQVSRDPTLGLPPHTESETQPKLRHGQV